MLFILDLYPDIVSSTPFLTELFDVKVKDDKEKVDTTLYVYLDEHQRAPWWGAIISAPFKVLGGPSLYLRMMK